ncbi:MAG: ABC transporter ATP-binding protein [Thermodesulfobacteriota bacterium]|nr:ABC transporter ATP-binding protein [Thermodesulfobacteriota bacterium]
MTNIISLDNVSFVYPDKRAILERVNLVLKKGDRAGLVGPNGSGKTTLFNIIMGLSRPSSGTIEIFGHTMHTQKDFIEVRKRMGLLFQNSNDQLFNPTVMEDVAFGPLNLGMDKRQARAVVRKTLFDLGMDGFEERITHKLSHGEKKMVAMAGILAMDPDLLILDEPTAGLDAATAERIVRILKGLDISYIVASHDLDFLFRITSRIYAMDSGRLCRARDMTQHIHTHIHPAGSYPHDHGGK